MIAGLAGLLAGSIHVLSGPDHLAAVAPLAADGRRKGWRAGLRWGVGHAAGVAAVGAFALLLRDILPLDALSSWSERLVGLVLIGIGLWGIRVALRRRVHVHAHAHGAVRHVHVHVHDPDVPHAHGEAHAHGHAAFAVGTLHGFAGSSHVLGVLPALAFPSRVEAVVYVASFALASVLVMAGFASVIGWAAGRFELGGAGAYRRFLATCSAAAILIGAYWLAG